MKQVLLLSPFFYPEAISTGRYNTALVQQLVRDGATVEVVASHPLYPDWRPRRTTEQLPGVSVHRGGGWLRYPRLAAFRRTLLEAWFAAHIALVITRFKPRVNRVVMVFPPSLFALVVRWLMPRKTMKIGIVHDLQGVLARSRWMIRIIRGVEGKALASCDRLIFLSRSMAARAVSDYQLDPSRVVVRYPFLTLQQREQAEGCLSGILPDGFVHVVYSGALGDKQEPDQLIHLMQALAFRHPEIRCHIFSAGPHFERLRDMGRDGVAMHPLVPQAALGELYARSAMQILPQAKGTADGALPSKLPNLLAAGVPVFAISDPSSEAALLLQEAGALAGCRVDEFDSPDTHARFDEFLQQVRSEVREDRIQRQRPFVEQMFGVEPVVAAILSD